jgi:hypothetical protein
VGGHLVGLSVSVVVEVVDDQAFLLGMLKPADLPEEL